MRLIDADRVCEYCGDYDMCKDEYIDFCAERDLLKKCPTIDPASLRPKGEWIDNHCSVCGMMPMGEELWESCDFAPPKFEWFMDFCPTCGADMRGDNDG